MDSLFGSVRSLSVTIVALILALIALGFLLKALGGWRRALASRSWPSTTGKVLSATVAAGRRVGRGGVSFYPMVTYEYQINGQRFFGNRIGFGTQIGTGIRSWAEGKAAQYAVSGAVEVYYNPTNPADAVLERSASGGWWNLFVAGVLIGAIFILFTAFGGGLPFLR